MRRGHLEEVDATRVLGTSDVSGDERESPVGAQCDLYAEEVSLRARFVRQGLLLAPAVGGEGEEACGPAIGPDDGVVGGCPEQRSRAVRAQVHVVAELVARTTKLMPIC